MYILYVQEQVFLSFRSHKAHCFVEFMCPESDPVSGF